MKTPTASSLAQAAARLKLRSVEAQANLRSNFERLLLGECGTIALTPADEGESIFCILFVGFEQATQAFRFTMSCEFAGTTPDCERRLDASGRAIAFASCVGCSRFPVRISSGYQQGRNTLPVGYQ